MSQGSWLSTICVTICVTYSVSAHATGQLGNNNHNAACVYAIYSLHAAGVYTNTYDAGMNARNGFPVFATMVEANWISKSEDKYSAFRLTDDDKEEINKLSKDPTIGKIGGRAMRLRLLCLHSCCRQAYLHLSINLRVTLYEL